MKLKDVFEEHKSILPKEILINIDGFLKEYEIHQIIAIYKQIW